MFQILEIPEIKAEKKLLPQFWLSHLNNLGPNKYFSVHYLKNIGRKQKVECVKKYVIWMGNFYFKSCIVPNSLF